MKSKTINRVKNMARPHLKTIVIVTILSIIINIGESIKPYLVKVIIDDYLSQGIVEKGMITIGMIGALYIGIVIVGNIIDFISQTTMNLMGEEIIYRLRNKLYKYIQNANILFHDKTPAGKLFVRLTNDVEDISNLFKEVVTSSLKDVILVIVMVIMMICLSIKLSLLAFIVIPFVIIFSYIITKILNKIYDKSKNIRTKINTFLAESIYALKLIKIFNIQKEKQQECEEMTKEYFKSRLPTGILEGLLPSLIFIAQNIGISIIIWACMNHWFHIYVEVGLIYMFVTYIKQIFEPITNIIEKIEDMQESMVSIDKIYEILEKEEYIEDFESGMKLESLKGDIEFRNVWFSYNNKDWVLQDVSFKIQAGQSIALVGKTGSGKTTITNLINRFYDIQQGEILIDGININNINKKALRRNIATILQDPFIFARDIKSNIRLNSNISDEQVRDSITLASADQFINALPNGINFVADERGSSFSEGQKQLLAFARIFAHSPSIFVLDEATANIDTKTEELIQKSIDVISKEKTSIFIAHRLSTIVNVDKIIVLDKGKIIEQGNHSELLKTEGHYSKLYHSYYNELSEV